MRLPARDAPLLNGEMTKSVTVGVVAPRVGRSMNLTEPSPNVRVREAAVAVDETGTYDRLPVGKPVTAATALVDSMGVSIAATTRARFIIATSVGFAQDISLSRLAGDE